MDIRMIEEKFSRARTFGDLFPIISDLIEHLMQYERQMEDKLQSLDSNNIVEIDFGRTRVKNLRTGGTTDERV